MGISRVLSWYFTVGFLMESILFSKESEVLGPIISTNAGSFQGLRTIPPGQENVVNAFLGIPYAKPPIGLHRFKKPQPIDYIPVIYKAIRKPPSCHQNNYDFKLPWSDKISIMSEDCLYLNIWAPERDRGDKKLKPVMFWIHGGGYTSGSSAMDVYDGQVMSALGDVVVVTHNYRLGALGFLNSMSDDDDAPGNVGLYDNLLALRWIVQNIKYFGGDPKKITLFGESAGAVTTAIFGLSHLSSELFQRIILESGSPYLPFVRNASQGVELGNGLAVLVGCANDTVNLSSHPKEVVKCLRNVKPTELTKSYFEGNGSSRKEINFKFEPLYGNELIPKSPLDIFLSKNLTVYDIFMGVNKDEGTALFAYVFPEVYQKYSEGELTMTKPLAVSLLEGFFQALRISDSQKAIDYYLRDIGDNQQLIVNAVCEAIGDLYITCPSHFLAEKYSEKGGEIHFYRFDQRPSTSPWPEWMGAAHFEEVEFVFGMPIRYPEKYQKEEKHLSEHMIRIWTNFAKFKDLKLQNGSAWPLYSRSNPVYATFETGEQKTGTGERKEACEFWRPYFNAE